MLKSLFPWKHNKTKHGKQTKEVMAEQQTTMNDELILQSQSLHPCHVCGRTFLPLPLKKHQKICEKTTVKKRKPFDSLRQRVEGTELAAFHQKTYLKKPEPEVIQPRKTAQKSWKEKHLEFVSAIRAAKGMPSPPEQSTPTTRTRSPKPKGTVSLSSANERCPSCDRHFGPKAYDRHVEWCKEKQARIQHSPASVLVAKERLEARIKYRVPPVKSKKSLVRDKYSSNGNFSDTASVQSSHTPTQLSRTPSIRKPKSLMHVGKVSNAISEDNNNKDKDDNKRDKEDNKRDRQDCKRERENHERERDHHKRERGDSKREREDSKREREDSKREREDHRREKEDNKRERDDHKREMEDRKREKEDNKRGREISKREEDNKREKEDSYRVRIERCGDGLDVGKVDSRERVTPVIGSPSSKLESRKSVLPKKDGLLKSKLNNLEVNDLVEGMTVNSLKLCPNTKKMVTWKDTLEECPPNRAKMKVNRDKKPCIVKKVTLDVPEIISSLSGISINQSKSNTQEHKRSTKKTRELDKILSSNDVFHKIKCTTNIPVVRPNFDKINKVLEKYKVSTETSEKVLAEKRSQSRGLKSKCSSDSQGPKANEEKLSDQESFDQDLDYQDLLSTTDDIDISELKRLEKYVFPSKSTQERDLFDNGNNKATIIDNYTEVKDKNVDIDTPFRSNTADNTSFSEDEDSVDVILQPVKKFDFKGCKQNESEEDSIEKTAAKRKIVDILSFLKEQEDFGDDILKPLQFGVSTSSETILELKNKNKPVLSNADSTRREASVKHLKPILNSESKFANAESSEELNTENDENTMLSDDSETNCVEDILQPWNWKKGSELKETKALLLRKEYVIEDRTTFLGKKQDSEDILRNRKNVQPKENVAEDTVCLDKEMCCEDILRPWKFDIKGTNHEVVENFGKSTSLTSLPQSALKPTLKTDTRFAGSDLGDTEKYVLEKRNSENAALFEKAKNYEEEVLQPLKFTLEADESHKELTDWFDQFVKDMASKNKAFEEDIKDASSKEEYENSTDIESSKLSTDVKRKIDRNSFDEEELVMNSKSLVSLGTKDLEDSIARNEDRIGGVPITELDSDMASSNELLYPTGNTIIMLDSSVDDTKVYSGSLEKFDSGVGSSILSGDTAQHSSIKSNQDLKSGTGKDYPSPSLETTLTELFEEKGDTGNTSKESVCRDSCSKEIDNIDIVRKKSYSSLEEKSDKERRNQRMKSAVHFEIFEPPSQFIDMLAENSMFRYGTSVDLEVRALLIDSSLQEKGFADTESNEKYNFTVKNSGNKFDKTNVDSDSKDSVVLNIFRDDYSSVTKENTNESVTNEKLDGVKTSELDFDHSLDVLNSASFEKTVRSDVCSKINKNDRENTLGNDFESAYVTESYESKKNQIDTDSCLKRPSNDVQWFGRAFIEKPAQVDTFMRENYNLTNKNTQSKEIIKSATKLDELITGNYVSKDVRGQDKMFSNNSSSLQTKDSDGTLLPKDSLDDFQDSKSVLKLGDVTKYTTKSVNEKLVYLFQSFTEFNLTPQTSINNLTEQNSSWSSINTDKICGPKSLTTFEGSSSQYCSSGSHTFGGRSSSVHCSVKKTFSTINVVHGGTVSKEFQHSSKNIGITSSTSLPNIHLKVEIPDSCKGFQHNLKAFDKNKILEIATAEFVKKCKNFEFKGVVNEDEYAVPKKKRRISSSSSEETTCQDFKNALDNWKKAVGCYNTYCKTKNKFKDKKIQLMNVSENPKTFNNCNRDRDVCKELQSLNVPVRPVTAASSVSISEYTPRTFGILEKVFVHDKKSAYSNKGDKEDLVTLTVTQCKRLLEIDKNKLPMLKGHFEKIENNRQGTVKSLKLPVIGDERKLVKKSCCSDKESEGNVSLPKICGGVQDGQKLRGSEEDGVGSKSSPAPTTYDPFESAQRQFMELLECDDFKPFTASSPLLTPLASRRPHTASLAPLKNTPKSPVVSKKTLKSADISHNSHTKKRASVIDPPSNFKDSVNSLADSKEVLKGLKDPLNNLEDPGFKDANDPLINRFKDSTSNFKDPLNNFKDSFESVVDDFELMESMINNDIDRENNELKLGNSPDSGFYLHCQNVKNQKEPLTLGLGSILVSTSRKYSDDMSSIDPSLINENDNLSIPEHFKVDDYSPTSTVDTDVTIQNSTDNVDIDHYSAQYDAKIAAIEPEVQKKPLVKRSVSLVSRSKKESSLNNNSNSNKGKKLTSSTKVTSKSVSSIGGKNNTLVSSNVDGEQVGSKKKNLPSLKRSMTLFEPVPRPPAMKNKEDVDNYFSEQDQKMALIGSMGDRKSPVNDDVPAEDTLKAEDLFAVDDEMYEEYKKYEEMYLKEKELQQRNSTEKKKQKTKNIDMNYGLLTASEEEEHSGNNAQSNKVSNDSAYGSLTRKTPKHRIRTPKLAPLEPKHVESTSSSGSENCPTSPSPFDTRLSKFCHECGTKFPVTSAKFCVECGVKRLVL